MVYLFFFIFCKQEAHSARPRSVVTPFKVIQGHSRSFKVSDVSTNQLPISE